MNPDEKIDRVQELNKVELQRGALEEVVRRISNLFNPILAKGDASLVEISEIATIKDECALKIDILQQIAVSLNQKVAIEDNVLGYIQKLNAFFQDINDKLRVNNNQVSVSFIKENIGKWKIFIPPTDMKPTKEDNSRERGMDVLSSFQLGAPKPKPEGTITEEDFGTFEIEAPPNVRTQIIALGIKPVLKSVLHVEDFMKYFDQVNAVLEKNHISKLITPFIKIKDNDPQRALKDSINLKISEYVTRNLTERSVQPENVAKPIEPGNQLSRQPFNDQDGSAGQGVFASEKSGGGIRSRAELTPEFVLGEISTFMKSTDTNAQIDAEVFAAFFTMKNPMSILTALEQAPGLDNAALNRIDLYKMLCRTLRPSDGNAPVIHA